MRATLPLPASRGRVAASYGQLVSPSVACSHVGHPIAASVPARPLSSHGATTGRVGSLLSHASPQPVSMLPPPLTAQALVSPRSSLHQFPSCDIAGQVVNVAQCFGDLGFGANATILPQMGQDWRWDTNASPRDSAAKVYQGERFSNAAASMVVRQSSAPEPFSPPWESSPCRSSVRLTSETPQGGAQRLEVSSSGRAESPRDRCSTKVAYQTAMWPRREASGGRRRENSLQRLSTRPAWGSSGSGGGHGSGGAGVPARRNDEVSSGHRTGIGGIGGSAGSSGGCRSPRDDRMHGGTSSSTVIVTQQQRSTPPGRCSSVTALPSDSGRRVDDIAQTLLQVQHELGEARQENSKLQEKLSKLKNLMGRVQKQADDARAERDRERLKAESLQKSSQQLMRQLKRESAKLHLLEGQLSAASQGQQWRQGSAGNPEIVSDASLQRNLGSSATATTRIVTEATVQETEDGRPDEVTMQAATMAVAGSFGMNSDGTPLGAVNLGDEAAGGGAVHSCELAHVSQLVRGAQTPLTGGGGTWSEMRTCEPEEDTGEPEQRFWEFVVQGQHEVQTTGDFASKRIYSYPDDAIDLAASRGIACVCSRGRRLDHTVPNQDDFVAARHTLVHGGHIALYGVFDGHGPAGHLCAAYARGALPESLFGQRTLLLKPEETLREAFRQTQACLLEQPFDTQHSGTTATLALVLSLPAPAVDKNSPDAAESQPQHQQEQQQQQQSGGGECWLFVAHVGDSRAILASHRGGEPSAFTVTALTRDHRPDDSDEADRIRSHGGEIRKLWENSGAVRVFSPGQDRPALALTRSLGASAAMCCGVSAVPEVSAYRLRPGVDMLLLLGTDGLFEFCSNTHAAGQLLKKGVSAAALEDLCCQSREQWANNSYNETVDDITAIAAVLPSESLADER